MGGSAENPILHNEEEEKENSPPTTTTPVSDRTTRLSALLRNRPFGIGIENVADYVCRSFFQ